MLPDMRDGLNNMTEKLTLDILNEGLSRMIIKNETKKRLDLSFPKFNLETGNLFDLFDYNQKK